uniref:Uncharacterized protein n=1 Tax=Nelumbo nucifera TaxID=4432 RepID=A0A822XZS7_NELNU|nr:TPA_asm: hypothetical protein HUJ06_026175 [Nelumbo nucifera]
MFQSWWYKGLLLSLLAFILLSEASRLPTGYWEQMLPKLDPSPPSSPSRGTNSVAAASLTSTDTELHIASDEGKV